MNGLDSFGISKENQEQYILTRGGQVVGVAFLVKSSEARNHLNELSWNLFPEFSQGQTSSSNREDSEAQVQPSHSQDQQPRISVNNASEAQSSLNQTCKQSSILEEDLGLSVTDYKYEEVEDIDETGDGGQSLSILEEDLGLSVTDDIDEEVEDMDEMGDGGQSSTDEDQSGDTDLSLLDRLHMEEAGETVLSETGIFTASLGIGNHRRDTLDPFDWEGSIMSPQKVSDSLVTVSRQLMTKSSMNQQPTQEKYKTMDQSRCSIMCDKCPPGTMVSRTYMKKHLKKYHARRDEVTTRSNNKMPEEQNGDGLQTPRTNRRTFKEPPAHASTPRQILNSDKNICDYSIKCEYCRKRILKKSMKKHVKMLHLAIHDHEGTCVFQYD